MILLNDNISSAVSNLNASSSAFDEWEPLVYRSEITSIIVVTLIMLIILIYYNITMKKLNPKDPPKGIAFFIFDLIGMFKNLVFEVLGKDFVKYTPYFLTIASYIFLCNIIGVIGLDNPTALTTVTFALGLATTLGTIIVGIKYQKSSFFYRFLFKFYVTSKKTGNKIMIPYCFNPFGLTDLITPWISISLRLWANITAGAIILALFYSIPMVFFHRDPTQQAAGPEIILFSFFAIPLHGFFDWLIGSIQTFVFVILTMCYWSSASEIEDSNYLAKLQRKKKTLAQFKKTVEEDKKPNVDIINVGSID